MSIETECPGCGRKLQVGDEHAGRQARCPVCGEICAVPGGKNPTAAEEHTTATAAAETASGWRMRTPEGQMYGPVDREALARWVAEGRVTADCELMEEADSAGWQPAASVFPVLLEAAASASPGEGRRFRYTAPHRGGLVLGLGVVGWLACCPLFGIAAWVMGGADLQEMRNGRMDPSGRGLTQAGTVLGMVQVIIALIGFLISLFVMFARIAVR